MPATRLRLIAGLATITAVLLLFPSQTHGEPDGTDIFVSDFFTGTIYKVNSASGAKSVVTNLGFPVEDGVIDSNGVSYWGGVTTGVKRIDINTNTVLPDVGTNICGPEGGAIDISGNVYFNTRLSPCSASGVWKITNGTASSATQVIPRFTEWGEGTTFLTAGPFAGHLLATDPTGGRIVRSSPADLAANNSPSTFISGIFALDVKQAPNGDIYVVGAGSIEKYTSSGTFIGTFASGLGGPIFSEFDASGNLYVAEHSGGQLTKIAPNGAKTVLAPVPGIVGVAIRPTIVPGTIRNPTPSDYEFLESLKFPWCRGNKDPRLLVQDWVDHKAVGVALDFGHKLGDEKLGDEYVRGTPVLSPLSGRITGKGFDPGAPPNDQYGNWVKVDAGNGWQVLLAHLANESSFAVGSPVQVGDIVGEVGSTGTDTAHIHVEIRWYDGKPDRENAQQPNLLSLFGYDRTRFLGQAYKSTFYSTNANPHECPAPPSPKPGLTFLASLAPSGASSIEVLSIDGFSVGDFVHINPEGSNAEYEKIVGISSLVLATPLKFTHEAGDLVLKLPPGPELTVTKVTGDTAVIPGGILDYAVAVKNIGNMPTDPPPKTVTLLDQLPAGAQFLSWSASKGVCSWDGSVVRCDIGRLASNEQVSIRIRMRAPNKCGLITNTVTVDPFKRITEIDETNNSASYETSIC